MWTPCDAIGDDGLHHCPYEKSYSGYSDEMCRVCCGIGVDESSYPEEYIDDIAEEPT